MKIFFCLFVLVVSNFAVSAQSDYEKFEVGTNYSYQNRAGLTTNPALTVLKCR